MVATDSSELFALGLNPRMNRRNHFFEDLVFPLTLVMRAVFLTLRLLTDLYGPCAQTWPIRMRNAQTFKADAEQCIRVLFLFFSNRFDLPYSIIICTSVRNCEYTLTYIAPAPKTLMGAVEFYTSTTSIMKPHADSIASGKYAAEPYHYIL